MSNKTYTNYFKNIYEDFIINIESIYEEKDYNNNIIDSIKNLIDKYKVKSIQKLINKHIINLKKNDINELIYYVQYNNKILENDIKNNTHSSKFIFYNMLNFLFMILHVVFALMIQSNISDINTKLLLIGIISIIIVFNLFLFVEIKDRYPPIFIQKFRLQKNLEIYKIFDNIHNGYI
jgi:hypothetical protein